MAPRRDPELVTGHVAIVGATGVVAAILAALFPLIGDMYLANLIVFWILGLILVYGGIFIYVETND